LYRIATMGEWRSGSDIDATLTSSAFNHLRATVQALMDEGICPPGDPTCVALELWSAAHGVAALLIAKPHLPFGDAEAFADRVLGAVFWGRVVTGLVGADALPQQMVDWLIARQTEGLPA
jgi:Tetracyclin repressor-like, C-terminal domain